jgi:hypothetical protein
MSNYNFLECPSGLVLNNLYDDPNDTKVLCTETPESPLPPSGGGGGGGGGNGDEPPPSGGGGGGNGDEPSPPPQGGPPPEQPYNICPNGYTAMPSYLSGVPSNTCEIIMCPTGYTLSGDSQGTKGCADSAGNMYVCPSGMSLKISEYGDPPMCAKTDGLNNAGDPMTGNNFGVCPTDYNKAQYTNICEYVPPAPFTNVNGFKSKKERKVESFSQNTNGKCKARY